MTDTVSSWPAATVPAPPSEKVIVFAAESYTAPTIVTVPQPETASTTGFVAMPDANVPAEEAVSKLSVTDDVDGDTSPDEANVNVSFELAAPVYGVENAAVTAVTVLLITKSATVFVNPRSM